MSDALMQSLESRTLYSKSVPQFQIIQNRFTVPLQAPKVGGKAVYHTVSDVEVSARQVAKRTFYNVSADPASGRRITLTSKGVLSIQGTSRGENFEIVGNRKRIEVMVTSGKSASTATLGSFSIDGIKSIAVEGGGGYDTLTVNAAVQTLIRADNIDARSLDTGVGTIAADPTDAAPGVYDGSTDHWLRASAEQIKTADRGHATVALLGDSMLAYFKTRGSAEFRSAFGKHSVDLGMAGDTTSQLLYRIQNQGLLDGMSPKLVVLNIGTNNATQSSDYASIQNGIAAVVRAIKQRLPHTKILLTAILPQHRVAADPVIDRVNQSLSGFGDTTVQYLDDTAPFRDVSGQKEYYQAGNIHLNEVGYKAWAALLAPVVSSVIA